MKNEEIVGQQRAKGGDPMTLTGAKGRLKAEL
jgi:hypothetical protein